ncbi:MAG TPA: MFS transporter [Caulobacteraceae bacterium]|nr:MFS transporter [Caulobacteraceae bacterium]
MSLKTRTKVAYGLGAVAQGVAVAGLSGAFLQIFLNQVMGLPAILVGTAIMVSLMADSVIDPLIGRWSDKTTSRWGRRHPFMYAAAIPVAVSFWWLWNAPAGLSREGLVAFSLTFMILVRISVSFYDIPSNALTPELTPNYNERTTLQSYRWFFGIIAGAVLPLILTQVFLAKGLSNRAGWGQWAAIAAAVMFVSIVVSALGTHDRIRELPIAKAPRQDSPASPKSGAWREVWRTLANRSLIALMLSGILGGVGGGIRNGLSLYFYSYFWGLKPNQFGLILPASLFGSLLGVFVAPPLSRAFGKKWAMIWLFALSVFTSSAPAVLRLIGFFPANGSPWLLPILIVEGVVTLTVAIAGFVLVSAMMADIVEDAAVRSGARSEGLLYAVNGLLPKFTGGIGAFVAGLLLTLVHFPTHAAHVDPAIPRRLVILYLPINAVFTLASIFVLALYRIDKATHERNLATLAQAAAEGERAHAVEQLQAG